MNVTGHTRTTPASRSPEDDSAWRADLGLDGAAGEEAVARLHALLLRATRHQVWRLRGLLPGAGTGDLEDLALQAADDATLSVLRRLRDFRGESRFTTWVYKFGILQAGVAVRRQSWRGREVTLDDTFVVVDTSPSVSDLTEVGDTARAVADALRTALTPHQRRVALALLVDEVPIDVLAERLGTTRNALYKTLHDARVRLRAALVASGHLDARPLRSKP